MVFYASYQVYVVLWALEPLENVKISQKISILILSDPPYLFLSGQTQVNSRETHADNTDVYQPVDSPPYSSRAGRKGVLARTEKCWGFGVLKMHIFLT